MAKNYPLIEGYRRRPVKEKDGSKGHGKPCVVCEQNTIGEKWVQVNWMRGDDECIRVCHTCWKLPEEKIIDAAIKAGAL